MGTLYDPVESDLASYQMTFILSRNYGKSLI